MRILLWFALVLTGIPAVAHHAPFIYDTDNERVLSGTVRSFEWVQPHTWVLLEVTNHDAATVVWELEGMSPLYLGRRGWTRYTLAPGDRVEVAFFPRRDGSRKGMFLHARLSDGSLKVMAVAPQRADH